MRRALSLFRRSQSGATAIEYALLASILAISLITGLSGVGTSVETMFGIITQNFASASGS